MINTTKSRYAKLFVNYVTKNHSDKIDLIMVHGDCINPNIKKPKSIDFAIRQINNPDEFDYELIGDLMDYMGSVVDEGDFNITVICDSLVQSYREQIEKGEVIYGQKT